MGMTAEERRERDAERKRQERAAAARAREEERARLASDHPQPKTMEKDVEAALKAMQKWLAPSDAAAIGQARMIARMIDKLTHEGDVVKALNAHGRLTRVLTELGGTPTVRMAHELRSLKMSGAGAESERDKGEGEAGGATGAGGNVSRFSRPAKRSA